MIDIPEEYYTEQYKKEQTKSKILVGIALFMLLVAAVFGLIAANSVFYFATTAPIVLFVIVGVIGVGMSMSPEVEYDSNEKSRIYKELLGYTADSCSLVGENNEITTLRVNAVYTTEEEKPYLEVRYEETINTKYVKEGFLLKLNCYLYLPKEMAEKLYNR